MDKMTQVLTGLVNRTDEGKLTRRPTWDSNSFIAAVDLIGVVIKPSGGSSPSGQRGYALEILNNHGLVAEALDTDADYASKVGARSVADEQRELITRLFRLARRSALDTRRLRCPS